LPLGVPGGVPEPRHKAQIIKLALELGVDPAMTVSCYQPDDAGRASGACDACRIRKAGFEAASIGAR